MIHSLRKNHVFGSAELINFISIPIDSGWESYRIFLSGIRYQFVGTILNGENKTFPCLQNYKLLTVSIVGISIFINNGLGIF